MNKIIFFKKVLLGLLVLSIVSTRIMPMHALWSFIKDRPKTLVTLSLGAAFIVLAWIKKSSDADIKSIALQYAGDTYSNRRHENPPWTWWGLDDTKALKSYAWGWITNVNPIIDEENGTTLLDRAIAHNKINIVKFLLDYGAKPAIHDAKTRSSSLLIAIERGYPEIIKPLLAKMTNNDLTVVNNRNYNYLKLAQEFYWLNNQGKSIGRIAHSKAQDIYNIIYDEYQKRNLPVGDRAVYDGNQPF
jgi:hypothetical protein